MKEVKLKLDDVSIEILSKLDNIHINSIVNYSIRKLKNDTYYKIILAEEEIEELIAETENENISENISENSSENISNTNETEEDEDINSFSW